MRVAGDRGRAWLSELAELIRLTDGSESRPYPCRVMAHEVARSLRGPDATEVNKDSTWCCPYLRVEHASVGRRVGSLAPLIP